MSTNILFITTLRSNLVLRGSNREAAEAMKAELPSTNPLPEVRKTYCHQHGVQHSWTNKSKACSCPPEESPRDLLIPNLSWSSDFSGRTWGYSSDPGTSVFTRFVSLLEGEGDFMVVWEGGYVTGLKIRDGKAIRSDVQISLKGEPPSPLQMEEDYVLRTR